MTAGGPRAKRRHEEDSEAGGGSRVPRRGRRPVSGVGWRELFLSDAATAEAVPLEFSLKCGHSLLVLDGVATPEECASLLGESAEVAARVRAQHFVASESDESEGDDGLAGDSSDDSALALPPAQCLMLSNKTRIRMPVRDMLSAQGQGICDVLLLRALARVRGTIPELARLLFGDCLEALDQCKTRLEFAAGEPAVNIYVAGGSFVPHEDGQSLTVLVNLSQAAAFEGGGTAFWSHAQKAGGGERSSDRPSSRPAPTVSLSPPPGTALLFGGDVTHAALAVTSGVRGVFVASFSAKGPD